MSDTVHIRNNSEHPLFLTPKVGGERVRLNPGWNEVPSGYIERGTGGFKGKGKNMKPRGGAFAHLFTDNIKVGKRMAPVLQIGTPVDGDDVHVVTVRPGLRSHYRTRQADEVSKRELEQAKALAALEARNEALEQRLKQVLVRLDGGDIGSKADQPGSDVPDIAGLELAEIKAKIKGFDAAALKQLLGAEVAGEDRAPVVKLLKKALSKAK